MKIDEESYQLIEEVGDVVDLHKEESEEDRLTKLKFESDYLFEYFKQLTTGQTGFGMSFNAWLEITKGWKHLGARVYQKVEEID
jgi:hypothetical protein